MNLDAIKRRIYAHRLGYAIAAAIVITLVLTSISLSLYVRSGASRLDLSRPGYEKARDQLVTTSDDDTITATGAVNETTITQFQTIFSERRANIDKLDPFSPTVVDDESLRLMQ